MTVNLLVMYTTNFIASSKDDKMSEVMYCLTFIRNLYTDFMIMPHNQTKFGNVPLVEYKSCVNKLELWF